MLTARTGPPARATISATQYTDHHTACISLAPYPSSSPRQQPWRLLLFLKSFLSLGADVFFSSEDGLWRATNCSAVGRPGFSLESARASRHSREIDRQTRQKDRKTRERGGGARKERQRELRSSYPSLPVTNPTALRHSGKEPAHLQFDRTSFSVWSQSYA